MKEQLNPIIDKIIKKVIKADLSNEELEEARYRMKVCGWDKQTKPINIEEAIKQHERVYIKRLK